MILSGKEIAAQMGKTIFIDPFDPNRINPNSYNLSLNNELLMYENDVLDMKKANPTKRSSYPKQVCNLNPIRFIWDARTNIREQTVIYRCWKVALLRADWVYASMSLRVSAMSVSRDIGRWRSFVSNPLSFIRT